MFFADLHHLNHINWFLKEILKNIFDFYTWRIYLSGYLKITVYTEFWVHIIPTHGELLKSQKKLFFHVSKFFVHFCISQKKCMYMFFMCSIYLLLLVDLPGFGNND